MQPLSFPVHRKLANDRSFFRITSPTHFIEVQRVGERCVVHELTATTYPDRVRIAELLEAGTGHVVEASAEEFDHWYARTGA